MSQKRGELGRRGEAAAVRHLRRGGYRILARNLRLGLGEVDLLAEEKSSGEVALVEVKTTTEPDPAPEEHLTRAKQLKLSVLAAELVQRYKLAERLVRFDLVAVVWPEGEKKPSRLTHHVGAFESLL